VPAANFTAHSDILLFLFVVQFVMNILLLNVMIAIMTSSFAKVQQVGYKYRLVWHLALCVASIWHQDIYFSLCTQQVEFAVCFQLVPLVTSKHSRHAKQSGWAASQGFKPCTHAR
jgi:hypothetical protein